jgi:hypothetical protein
MKPQDIGISYLVPNQTIGPQVSFPVRSKPPKRKFVLPANWQLIPVACTLKAIFLFWLVNGALECVPKNPPAELPKHPYLGQVVHVGKITWVYFGVGWIDP